MRVFSEKEEFGEVCNLRPLIACLSLWERCPGGAERALSVTAYAVTAIN